MALPSRLFVSCISLLSGCGGLSQVPSRAPHGTLHFRVVHPPGDELYIDSLHLDHEQPVVMEGLRNNDQFARLSPGKHHVSILSRRASYELGSRRVQNPYGQCVGPACTQFAPTTETRTELVPTAGAEICRQELTVEVREGEAQLVLVQAARADQVTTCRSCVSKALSARSCP